VSLEGVTIIDDFERFDAVAKRIVAEHPALSNDGMVYMRQAAATRGIEVRELTLRLLDVIAKERMVDAVLDDGVSTSDGG
jgi:hypothetical protein